MEEGNTLLNALVGAVVSVVTTFLPFSPVIGGGVAGYLQKGDLSDGAKVGALAGVIAMIPLVFVFLFVGAFFVVVPSDMPIRGLGVGGLFVLFLVSVVGFYTVGLSALGGALGAYLAAEL
ncbi:MAG: DUF5518 domain-containing protein [Halobacteriota archaeon]